MDFVSCACIPCWHRSREHHSRCAEIHGRSGIPRSNRSSEVAAKHVGLLCFTKWIHDLGREVSLPFRSRGCHFPFTASARTFTGRNAANRTSADELGAFPAPRRGGAAICVSSASSLVSHSAFAAIAAFSASNSAFFSLRPSFFRPPAPEEDSNSPTA